MVFRFQLRSVTSRCLPVGSHGFVVCTPTLTSGPDTLYHRRKNGSCSHGYFGFVSDRTGVDVLSLNLVEGV